MILTLLRISMVLGAPIVVYPGYLTHQSDAIDTMTLLTDAHREWIGTEEGRWQVEISRRDIQKYAAATEQQQARYIRGDEAPPMFIFNLFADLPALADLRADGLPARKRAADDKDDNRLSLPLKRIMAGGTQLELHQPIRPGDTLVGVRRIADIYEKQGSSGPLIFTVRRLEISDGHGELVMIETQTSIAR